MRMTTAKPSFLHTRVSRSTVEAGRAERHVLSAQADSEQY
jgi:hypothetical protein